MKKYLLFLITFISCSVAYSASFDCQKAQSTVEKAICSNPDLSNLDEDLLKEYKGALSNSSNPEEVKLAQRAWLKEIKVCGTSQSSVATCLTDAYTNRIAELSNTGRPLSLASTYDDIKAAYRNGDFSNTIKMARPLAEQGSAILQSLIGVMYYSGQGVIQDYQEAVKWFRAAADQGLAQAQYNIGVMHREGQGVAQSDQEALKWYRLSAVQGFALGQTSLGVMYVKGQGTSQNFQEAAKWFKLAAAQGDATATANLRILADGIAPKAALSSQETKSFSAEELSRNRKSMGKGESISSKEQENETKKFQLAPQAKIPGQNLGNVNPQNAEIKPLKINLKDAKGAIRYQLAFPIPPEGWHGSPEIGVPTDDVHWRSEWSWRHDSPEIGGATGEIAEQYKAGLRYFYGDNEGTGFRNFEKALKWFRVVAARKNELGLRSIDDYPRRAEKQIGLMYAYGLGVDQSYQEAIKWFRAAESGPPGHKFNFYRNGIPIAEAESGLPSLASYNLGVMYLGLGTQQDFKEAMKWFQKSLGGDDDVQNTIGFMYLNGFGVAKDAKEALKQFREAARSGSKLAKSNLELPEMVQAMKMPQEVLVGHIPVASLPLGGPDSRAAAVDFYVETATIRRVGGKVTAWYMVNIVSPQAVVLVKSKKSHLEHDCEAKTSKLLTVREFMQNMGNGMEFPETMSGGERLIQKYPGGQIRGDGAKVNYEPVKLAPGSIDELLWQQACGTNSS